ncbi:DNA adenine methylase [Blautia sp.]|uniref:DNA adenine methylase n=1 Tax=Blautia sp. TaxID=1955243 RepID=UPI003AB7942F
MRRYDRPETLFYVDPPYFQAEKYYAEGFGETDHIRLKEVLDKMQGRFVLTYNDCPFVRELYRQYPAWNVRVILLP